MDQEGSSVDFGGNLDFLWILVHPGFCDISK